MENRNAVKIIPAPTVPSMEGLSDAVKARIAEYNARPARRVTDVRVHGWQMVEVTN